MYEDVLTTTTATNLDSLSSTCILFVCGWVLGCMTFCWKRGRQKNKKIGSCVVSASGSAWVVDVDGVICDVKQYLLFSDTSQTSRRGTKVPVRSKNDLARGERCPFHCHIYI